MRELILKPRLSMDVQPMVASATLLAAGLIRSMTIKRYVPGNRRRELELLRRRPETHPGRCTLYRERGSGSVPTIVVGGFVPDATETVEFQRDLLRRFGSIYYLNYPRGGFCREMFAAQLADLIDDLAARRRRPILFGVSFGCGLLADLLRRADETLRERIRGLVLVSPVLCGDDLIRPAGERKGGVRLLEHNLKRLLEADPNDAENLGRLVERGRRCFQALFNGGAENRVLSTRHLSIRERVFDVISGTSSTGGFQRVMALRDFRFPDPDVTLFGGPVLTLLAEREEEMLVPGSPTLGLFRDVEVWRGPLPGCKVRTVRSADPSDRVPHASLIFHHQAYRLPIEEWYDRLVCPSLRLAV